MDRDEFWELVEASRGISTECEEQAEALVALLARRTPAEIIAFDLLRRAAARSESDSQALQVVVNGSDALARVVPLDSLPNLGLQMHARRIVQHPFGEYCREEHRPHHGPRGRWCEPRPAVRQVQLGFPHLAHQEDHHLAFGDDTPRGSYGERQGEAQARRWSHCC